MKIPGTPPGHRTRTNPPPRAGYRPEIDGLRAVAVMAVLFYHLGFGWASGGFVGVDVFFVISGYLITGIIRDQIHAGQFSFMRFYARRIARIFPALFTMLAFSGVAAFLLLDPDEYRNFFRAAKYAALQISNFFFARGVDYFAQGQAPSPLLHTWSLGVEEQFYLLWPLLCVGGYALWRKGKGKMLAIMATSLFIGSFLVSEWLVRHDSNAAFYMLHARAWELAAGAVIALGILPEIKDKICAGAISVLSLFILGVVFIFYDAGHFPGFAAAAPVMAAALFIYSARATTGIGHKILSLRPFLWIGLISYPLYLWHWPWIAFYRAYFETDMTLPVQFILAGGGIVCAWLSYVLVERPIRHRTKNPRRVVIAGLCTIAALVVVTGWMRGMNDSPLRVQGTLDKSITEYSPIAKSCAIKGAVFTPDATCKKGDPSGTQTALLLGDSHAGHYSEMIDRWATDNRVALDIIIKDGCTSWLTMENLANPTPAQRECESFKNTLARHLQETGRHYDYLFLGQYASGFSVAYRDKAVDSGSAHDLFAADVKNSLNRLTPFAKHRVILGEVPVFPHHPPACFYQRSLLVFRWLDKRPAQECLLLDIDYSAQTQNKSRHIMQDAGNAHGFSYFEPQGYIISALQNRAPDAFFYKDSNHLNVAGALVLVPPFQTFMDAPARK